MGRGDLNLQNATQRKLNATPVGLYAAGSNSGGFPNRIADGYSSRLDF